MKQMVRNWRELETLGKSVVKNKKTNTVEIGTNLYVDGHINSNYEYENTLSFLQIEGISWSEIDANFIKVKDDLVEIHFEGKLTNNTGSTFGGWQQLMTIPEFISPAHTHMGYYFASSNIRRVEFLATGNLNFDTPQIENGGVTVFYIELLYFKH